MNTTIDIHLHNEVQATKHCLCPEGGSPFVSLKITEGAHDVFLFLKPENVDQFVDEICTATYGKSFSEMAQSYNESESENEDKDAYIEKLENELDEMKASLSAPEDTADDHELY